MARDNSITIAGNLTRDPDLSYTPGGVALAKFGLAWNPPGKPKQGGGYEDQPPHFFNITCWADMAEHAAESLTKGMRVHVTGNLEYRSWEKDGEKKSAVEIRADEISPSLRWATADVTRTEKGGGGVKAPQQTSKATQYDYDEEPF